MDRPREIHWHIGDLGPLDFPIYDPKDNDPNEPDLTKPVDLSGATAIRFAIASKATDTANLISKSLVSGIVVTGPSSNVVRVSFIAADWTAPGIVPGRFYYEVDIVEAGGRNWTGPHGPFRLHASILT